MAPVPPPPRGGGRAVGSEGGNGDQPGLGISSADLSPFVDAYADEIAAALAEVLAEIPPPLRREMHAEGILLTGGAAHLHGLDSRLAASCGLAVRVATEPQLCAVRGAGLAVDNVDMLKRNVMYLR